MTDSEAQPVNSLTILETDVCHRCAYSLQGLHADGVCPECGTPVRDTLTFLLRNAPPEYLRQIGLGLQLITLTLVAKILAVPIFVWMLSFPRPDILPWQPFVIGIAAFTVGWVGYWKFATVDPRLAAKHKAGSMRRLIRPSLSLHAGALLFWLIWTCADVWREMPEEFSELMNVSLALVILVSGLVLDFSALTHARWIATRIPDRGFVKLVTPLRWAVTLLPALIPGYSVVVATPLLSLLAARLRGRVLAVRP